MCVFGLSLVVVKRDQTHEAATTKPWLHPCGADLSCFFLRRRCRHVCTRRRMRNDRGNILTSGIRRIFFWKMHAPHSRLRLRRNGDWLLVKRWKFVSSHSSATASDSHGVPSHGHCFKARKELRAPCARAATFYQVKKIATLCGTHISTAQRVALCSSIYHLRSIFTVATGAQLPLKWQRNDSWRLPTPRLRTLPTPSGFPRLYHRATGLVF